MKKQSRREQRYGTLDQYKKVCKELWEERGKCCEDCGRAIPELRFHNINHTQGRRHNYMNKETLQLLCFRCHSKYHGIEEKNADWLDY